MVKKTLYSFDSTTSTGIDKVPLNNVIFIEDSDGAGTPKQVHLIDKTGVTGATTISTLLSTPSLYKNVSNAWGEITGTLSNQSDLQSALDLKATQASVDLKAPIDAPNFTTDIDAPHIRVNGGLIWTNSMSMSFNQITFYNGSGHTCGLNMYDTSDVLAVDAASLTTNGTFTASGNITANSDKRIKTNIEVIQNAIYKILQLNGYTFDRTDINTARQTGVIAQEVLKVLPEAVITGESEEDIMSVAYGNMIGLLVEGIKEQQSQIDELKNEINILKGL